MEAGADLNRAGARPQATDLARKLLIVLAALGSIAVVSGTIIYCYPTALGELRRPVVLVHDASGDLSLGIGIWYLWVHLSRVWRMKRRKVSRWSGYLSVGAWSVAGGTGVFGQLVALEAGTAEWLVHLISSVALIVVVCFHGAWGLRPKLR